MLLQARLHLCAAQSGHGAALCGKGLLDGLLISVRRGAVLAGRGRMGVMHFGHISAPSVCGEQKPEFHVCF